MVSVPYMGKKKADWYDPFILANDDSFVDVDMSTLTFKRRGLKFEGW
jgi:hypothetical protein